MDYDQAVKNGDIFFGWSTWMEQDGYAQVNQLHLTLRMEVEPIPIRERLRDLL